MATFSWDACVIDMSNNCGGLYNGAIADVARVPNDPDATIAFAHEYVHYLQSISTVAGAHILGELVDCAVVGALLLQGVVPDTGGVVQGYHPVLADLKGRANHEGAGLAIRARVDSFFDEATAQFETHDYPYSGNRQPWEIDSALVSHGSYVEPMRGFVTPSGTWRPFNIAFLAENMARRIDRWLAANHSFAHTWPASTGEQEHYNGLKRILEQPRYSSNVTTNTVYLVSGKNLALFGWSVDVAGRDKRGPYRRVGEGERRAA